MKKILYLLAFAFTTPALAAPVFKKNYDGITFAKWQLNSTGEVFYSTAERDAIISARNVYAGTGTALAPSDFTNIAPSPDYIAITTTVYNAILEADGLTVTISPQYPADEIANRLTTKAAALDLAVATVLDLRACQDIQSNTGLSLTARMNRDKAILEYIKRLWAGLQ